MAVTSNTIRAILNRPRGLNEDTISELITIRTNQVNKMARGSLYGVGDYAVTDDLKDDAVKVLVCLDCLNILVDTVPTYYSESERSVYDRRYQQQILTYQQRADEALKLIAGNGASAFTIGNTTSRLP